MSAALLLVLRLNISVYLLMFYSSSHYVSIVFLVFKCFETYLRSFGGVMVLCNES